MATFVLLLPWTEILSLTLPVKTSNLTPSNKVSMLKLSLDDFHIPESLKVLFF